MGIFFKETKKYKRTRKKGKTAFGVVTEEAGSGEQQPPPCPSARLAGLPRPLSLRFPVCRVGRCDHRGCTRHGPLPPAA